MRCRCLRIAASALPHAYGVPDRSRLDRIDWHWACSPM